MQGVSVCLKKAAGLYSRSQLYTSLSIEVVLWTILMLVAIEEAQAGKGEGGGCMEYIWFDLLSLLGHLQHYIAL